MVRGCSYNLVCIRKMSLTERREGTVRRAFGVGEVSSAGTASLSALAVVTPGGSPTVAMIKDGVGVMATRATAVPVGHGAGTHAKGYGGGALELIEVESVERE